MKEILNTSKENSIIKSSVAREEAKEYFKLATPMLLTQLAAHATGIISALILYFFLLTTTFPLLICIFRNHSG